MKLPISALVFLANLDIEFTVNFLGCCLMNAVDGDQVRRSKRNLTLIHRAKIFFQLTQSTAG